MHITCPSAAPRVHVGCEIIAWLHYWFPDTLREQHLSHCRGCVWNLTFRILCNSQLLEQYAEQVSWQSEIRHEAIRFPPMDKMIVDYQVCGSLKGIPPTR